MRPDLEPDFPVNPSFEPADNQQEKNQSIKKKEEKLNEEKSHLLKAVGVFNKLSAEW